MNTNEFKIKAYLLQDHIAGAYGFDSNIEITFLAQGEYNKNFIVLQGEDKYVFRINMDSQLGLSNQIEYEFNAIKKLEKSGVTPRVYFYDDSRHYFSEGVLLMEFLEGRPLEYNKDLLKAAEIFARIHQMDTEPFEEYLITEENLCHNRLLEADKWLVEFRHSEKPAQETKELMEALYGYCKDVVDTSDKYFKENPWKVVNNTEVNSHNFIIGKETSFLIDWEKPVLSDPVQDITQFLAPTTTLWKTQTVLSDEQLDAFYSKYELLVGREIRDRVKMYEPFLFLRAFSWCAGAWMQYTDKSRNIQNNDTFNVINKYLSPDFMKKTLKEYI